MNTASTATTTRSSAASRRTAARLAVVALSLGLLASCAGAGASGLGIGHKGPTTTKTKMIPKDGNRTKTKTTTNTDANTTGTNTTDTTGTTSTNEPSPQVKEFSDELVAVAQNVQSYWAEQITDGNGNSTYVPPADIVTYIGSQSDRPSCNGQQVSAQNSFFCPQDNTLLLDVEWLYQEYQDIGDMFIYVLVSHEYGHSAQYNLGEPDQSAVELQADCFAGSELQWELDKGTVTLEQGDEEEVNQTLAYLAGEYGTTDNHGTLAQRSGAFEYGRTNGAAACQYPGDYIS